MAMIWRRQLQRSCKCRQWFRRYANPTLMTSYHCGRCLLGFLKVFAQGLPTSAGRFVGALRMSYHDVQIRCALANFRSQPFEILHSSNFTMSRWNCCLDAIAKLLHHRSLYSANQVCFNDARKSSSRLSWMQRHFASADVT